MSALVFRHDTRLQVPPCTGKQLPGTELTIEAIEQVAVAVVLRAFFGRIFQPGERLPTDSVADKRVAH